jgi:tetratricopeptide (TPR) repeat protein
MPPKVPFAPGLAVLVCVLLPAHGLAQPTWVEVKAPNVTVVSDASANLARDIAWQFEQVRQALSVTFPWVRSNLSRPLMVLAARSEPSMRALVPSTFERRGGGTFSSIGVSGLDRSYIALRADLLMDDREGVNPYQNAYWAYAARALTETFPGLPLWLHRGMATTMSNTLVRKAEIQVGRMLPDQLGIARGQGRLPLVELVALANDDPRLDRPEFLNDVDANAWAFVHFLIWGEQGARLSSFNAFVTGVLNGRDPATELTATIGDVTQLQAPFNVHINRSVYSYTKFEVSAQLSREGFTARTLSPAEAAVARAGLHAATNRPAEASALIAEAQKRDPSIGVDEIRALLAERGDRQDDVRTALERAVTQKNSSWYAHYRLATLLPFSKESLPRLETLAGEATRLNANNDDAWALLGQVMAALDRGETALDPVQRAIRLMPSSSRHRAALARVLQRLGRRDEAIKAAGLARALARTQAEREAAQGLLVELTKKQVDHDHERRTNGSGLGTCSASIVITMLAAIHISGKRDGSPPVSTTSLTVPCTTKCIRAGAQIVDPPSS